ncbi:MAG: DUF2628 domain-containing protein [Methylocystaceae bacterium]|nr:DUF2628 domain-containing protein [Methylocystaceae bacterium]
MVVFTALSPKTSSEARDLFDRTVFLSDGFCWSAFLLGPLWLAFIRHWLGIAFWFAALALLLAVQNQLEIDSRLIIAAALGSAFFLGLEGNRIREHSLLKRGYHMTGFIAADRLRDAEDIYFRTVNVGLPKSTDIKYKSMPYSSTQDIFPMLETGQ